MEVNGYFIALIIYSIIVLLYVYLTRSTVIQCNDVDNQCYQVSRKYDPETYRDASRLLAQLNSFLMTIVGHMEDKYIHQAGGDDRLVNMTQLLLYNFDPANMQENAPISDVNTSYVQNKGSVFAVCLREKDTGKESFHDIETLKFVALHELAHLSTPLVDHETEFWKNFKLIIIEAIETGMYNPIDYSVTPVRYCSIDITYNPYFDKKL